MYQEKREYLKPEISVNLFCEVDIITSSTADLGAEGNVDESGWT